MTFTKSHSRGPGSSASGKADTTPLDNDRLASRLEQVSEVLDAQGANPFRVRAWRNAAETVRHLSRPAWQILEETGMRGLMELPTIGMAIARAIEALVHTGHLALLDRLNGDARTPDPFTTVPGIGPELARRIHEELGIETLHELEIAAWDGRLDQVPGLGRGRVRAVRESLAGRFRRPPARVQSRQARDEPPLAELLSIDEEYRAKAGRGDIALIAPKRFNPTGEAWLPVLHTRRGDRHYTALYSNTARAHELGTTRDWVVVYRDDPGGDGQWTIVTARLGKLRGRRIVRGREVECKALFREGSGASASRSRPSPRDRR
jgi:putative hydrolase